MVDHRWALDLQLPFKRGGDASFCRSAFVKSHITAYAYNALHVSTYSYVFIYLAICICLVSSVSFHMYVCIPKAQ